MTDQSDYRIYLESKFNALHEKLDTIVTAVKETNGSVIELEKEDTRIERKVDDAILWAHHVVDSRVTDCPLLPRIIDIECEIKSNADKISSEIDRLENDLFEWRFFKKYPKLAFIGIAIVVVSIIISFIGTIETFGNKKRGKEILQNQQDIKDETRSINTYDPFDTTKADSLDNDHVNKMDTMYEKYMKGQK